MATWTSIGKVISQLFNMLSRLVVAFLPRSKHLLNFMAVVTIYSDFGAPQNEVCHCFHCFPIYLSWSDETGCHDLSFWMLSFKPTFSLSSFTFINRLFSSSSHSSKIMLKILQARLQQYVNCKFQMFKLIVEVRGNKDKIAPGRSVQFSSVAQSCPTLCMNHESFHELQHARPPCPSPSPGVHSDSRPLSQWCHPAISSSVVTFSSCPQSLPTSESFPMSQFFSRGGKSTGVSDSASLLPKNSQGWSPSEWTGWISLQSKGLSRVFSNTTVQKHQFFGTQFSS